MKQSSNIAAIKKELGNIKEKRIAFTCNYLIKLTEVSLKKGGSEKDNAILSLNALTRILFLLTSRQFPIAARSRAISSIRSVILENRWDIPYDEREHKDHKCDPTPPPPGSCVPEAGHTCYEWWDNSVVPPRLVGCWCST